MQGAIDKEQVLFNIILLVAKIILDNWRCFSFWHQVFVFGNFLFISQSCYQQLTPYAGVWSASAHWLRTNLNGGSLYMQSLHAQFVSGTLHYRSHVHRDEDAQTIYHAALVDMLYSFWQMQTCSFHYLMTNKFIFPVTIQCSCFFTHYGALEDKLMRTVPFFFYVWEIDFNPAFQPILLGLHRFFKCRSYC